MNKETRYRTNQKLLEETIEGKQKVSNIWKEDEQLNEEEFMKSGYEEDDPDYEPEIVEWDSTEFGKETDTQKRFKKDMLKAGYTVQLYRGRYFYRGYAVTVPRDNLQDAIRSTKVKIQYDNLGLDYIMYPR